MFFMDMTTFEETVVDSAVCEDVEKWVAEGMEVTLINFKGSIIEVAVPQTVTYEIVETEPSVKGNSVQVGSHNCITLAML